MQVGGDDLSLANVSGYVKTPLVQRLIAQPL